MAGAGSLFRVWTAFSDRRSPAAVLGGPSGWFDGITLSTDFDDTIFRNGFE